MPRSVSAVACTELSYMFVFAPDLPVARRSEAGGDIKAIWPTYSDLPRLAQGSLLSRAHTVQNHRAEDFQDTRRHTVFNLSQVTLQKKMFASFTMVPLCKRAIILTSNSFKVVIRGSEGAFYFNFMFW